MKSYVVQGVWRTIGGLSLIIWLAGTACLPAQVVKLLDYTNTFKYNETANLDGVNWTDRSYNDTTWPSGQALLAFENAALGVPIRTVLGDPRFYSTAGHAVYFRAHFNYNSLHQAILTLTNRIDDGAVFYLNGVEIQRINVTANPAMFASLATASAVEGTVSNFTYIATNLVVGDNVLSAIVLQSSTNSADTVYGTILWAENLSPVIITNQPADVATELNGAAVFNVAASGMKPAYQWQYGVGTNGPWITASGTSTNASYSIASAQFSHDGYYRAVISNAANSVTSQVARLTVTIDTAAPRMVTAVASETTNAIIVLFNERVMADTATNKFNYAITVQGGTNQLVISNAQVNASQVRLTVQPWVEGSNYILTVNNVADTNGNVILPNSKVGLSFWKDIFPIDHAWNWSDAGVDLGTEWAEPGYNEATNTFWALANSDLFPVTKALFYATYSSLPGPKNTSITIGSPTYYFRTRFVLPPGTPPFGSLRFSHMVDDGAVFYLNGQEVYRYNMPAGSVHFSSLAAAAVSSPTLITPADFAVTNLVAGTNVLAVETHVSSLDFRSDSTVVFGSAMRIAVAPVVDEDLPPRLDVRREVTGHIVLRWVENGFVLQSAPTPRGAWTSLPQASSPHTNAVNEAQQYFRLEQ